MSRTLILHVGHFKTGTTALQVFVQRNEQALERRGLAYARTGRSHSKHSVYALSLLASVGVATLLHGYRSRKSPESLWAGLLDELRSGSAPMMLVSSEEFMRFGSHPAAAERLGAILSQAPDISVRVIAYLRPIRAHLESWHNQLVKLGLCRVGRDEALGGLIEAVHFDYGLALGPWARLAGPGGLTVRPYRDALRKGNALYRDFLDALGVGMPAWPHLPQGDPNPRLDDRLLDLARALAGTDLDPAQCQALLARARVHLDAAAAERAAALPDLAGLRDRAARGLRAAAGLAGPGFPLDEFLSSLPEPVSGPQPDHAALLDFLVGELVAGRPPEDRPATPAAIRPVVKPASPGT